MPTHIKLYTNDPNSGSSGHKGILFINIHLNMTIRTVLEEIPNLLLIYGLHIYLYQH
jgi:hypothetical protein